MRSLLWDWLILVLAAILSVVLVVFGVRLLLAPGVLGVWSLFLLGCLLAIAGVYLVSAPVLKSTRWGLALLLVSGYFFARASGVIGQPWLGRLLGLAAIVAAGIVIYAALQKYQAKIVALKAGDNAADGRVQDEA